MSAIHLTTISSTCISVKMISDGTMPKEPGGTKQRCTGEGRVTAAADITLFARVSEFVTPFCTGLRFCGMFHVSRSSPVIDHDRVSISATTRIENKGSNPA